MKTKFRKFLAYLLVLMLICSDLAVPVFAEELANPEATDAPALGPTVVAPPASEPAVSGGTLTLPAALKIIEEEAFCGNTSISRVIVPEGATTIEARAFADSSLTEIVLPSTLSSIDPNAFSGCGQFAVSAPEGSYAYNWAVEKGYIVPSSATPAEYFETELLEDGTLMITRYTGKDVDVIIPDAIDGVQVTALDRRFIGPTFTETIVLPDSISSIDPEAFDFYEEPTLLSIEVSDSHPLYSSVDGVLYSKDGTVLVNHPDGKTAESFAIPEGVTTIGEYAFAGDRNLKTVDIPDSVTEIGARVFNRCTALESIAIPEGVTTLRSFVFGDCTAMTSVSLPSTLTTLEDGAFSFNIKLTELVLPESVTWIGDNAFDECYELETINLPAGVGFIGEYAFGACSNLTATVSAGSYAEKWCSENGVKCVVEGATPAEYFETELLEDGTLMITRYTGKDVDVIIPDAIDGVQVTALGHRFIGPSFTETIVLPDSISSIDPEAFDFYEEPTLVSIEVSDSHPLYSSVDGVLYSKDGTVLVNHPDGKTSESFAIPEGVTTIGEYAFAGDRNLKAVDIPDSVTEIGARAFNQAMALESIVIPEGITTISFFAFEACTHVTSISLPSTLTTIEDGAFGLNIKLTELVLPESVTTLGESAFEECYTLKSINLPAAITSIGKYAFDACSALTATVSAGSYAEKWCSENGVKCVVEGTTPAEYFEIEQLDSNTVAITGYTGPDTDVIIPGTIDGKQVTEISQDAFKESGLTSVVIPEGVTFVESYAFFNCSNLAKVTLPTTIERIDHYAFLWSGIEEINLPEGLEFIGDSAFQGARFTTLHIPSTVTSIYEWSFRVCRNLTAITVAEGNPVYKAIDGVLMTRDNTLMLYPIASDRTSYTVPEGIVEIGAFAFEEVALTSIELPESLERIKANAFFESHSLTGLHIPANVSYIEEGFFSYCSALSSITVSEDNGTYKAEDNVLLTRDGRTLLLYLSSAAEYTVPDSVTAIAREAFGQRHNLTRVTLPDGLTSIGDYAFNGCSSLEIINIPSSCTYVGMGAFGGCDSLKEIVIPEGVTMLDYGVFFGCSRLESVTLPESLTTLGSAVFFGCTSLTSLYLPESITSIDESAFEEAPNVVATVVAGSYAEKWCSENNVRFISVGNPSASFTTKVLEDGTLAITGYTGTDTDIVIPGTIDGAAVSAVADYAFEFNNTLTSVTFEEGITSIGYRSFLGCDNLTSITLPDSLVTMDYRAFAFCSKLTEVNFGSGLTTLNGSAFQDCSSLTSITLPASLREIDTMEFANCFSLTEILVEDGNTAFSSSEGILYSADGTVLYACPTGKTGSVTVPAGVTAIDGWAFFSSPISSVTLPEGLISIGSLAFNGCSNLASITLPASLTTIEDGVFEGCTSLTELSVAEGSNSFSAADDILYSADGSILHLCLPAKTGALVIGQGVAEIADRAFGGCSQITSVQLPEGLTRIGKYAFYDCSALEEVVLMPGLKTVGTCAFMYCSSLTSLSLPEGTATLEPYAFEGSSLRSLYLPKSISSIGTGAFNWCTGLTVTVVEGSYAHTWCSNNNMSMNVLEDVTPADCFATEVLGDGTLMITGYTGDFAEVIIPSAINDVPVTMIAGSAFSGNKTITGVVIPESVKTLGEGVFFDCGNLTSVTLPGGITSLPTSAFSDCFKLTEINLPEGLTYLGDYSFSFCQSLAGLALPSTLTYIGEQTFCYTTSLKELVLPEGLTTIGSEAFYGSALESVAIPSTVTTIGSEPFLECRSLKRVTIEEGVTHLSQYMFTGCTALTTVTLPGSLVSMAAAFERCTSLTYIVIPANVSEIAEGAFADCPNLTVGVYSGSYAQEYCARYEIPCIVVDDQPGVEDFGYDVTEDNTVLITGYTGESPFVTVPATIDGLPVTAINDCAFMQTSIETIILPEGLTHIYSEAFGGCTKLRSVSLPSTLQSIDPYTFINCDSLTGIVLPDGLTRIGDQAFWECDSLASITLPGSLKSLGDYAFSSCPSLTSVTLNEGITALGYASFDNCTALTEVILPDSLTDYGSHTFYGCSALTSITVPANVSEVGYNPFQACSSLTEVEIAEGNEWYCFEDGLFLTADRSELISCLATKAGDMTIPEYVTSLRSGAFGGCRLLTSIIIPRTVTRMEYPVFSGCEAELFVYPNSSAASLLSSEGEPFTYLDSAEDDFTYTLNEDQTAAITGYTGTGAVVVIPSQLGGNNVTAIAENAFNGNEVITEIRIPEGVTSIGNGAFANCPNPIVITVPRSVTSIGSEVITGGGGVSLIVHSGSHAEQWCIGQGLEYIQAGAEYLRYEVDENGSVTITEYYGHDTHYDIPAVLYGAPVVAIGEYAFSDRSSLRSVTIPASVTNIPHTAFDDSWRLASIEVDSDNPAYTTHDGVIYTKDMTAVVLAPNGMSGSHTIPEGVTTIREYAFRYCDNLTQITLPESLTAIGMYAFYYTGLTSLTMPDSVIMIGDYAFAECYDLASVSLSSQLAHIGERAFNWCESLTEITLPDSLTTMGQGAFCECYGLCSVTFGSGLTEIPQSAFGCTDLTEVIIPEGVTTIGRAAFGDVGGLKSVSLPSTLTTLGQDAFAYSGLTTVNLPAALVNLNEAAFRECFDLTGISVDAANPAYCSVDGVLFSEDLTRLICYPCAKNGSYEIPAGVSAIADGAFRYCSLESVVVPEGVAALGEYTFAYSDILSSVTLPESLTAIDGTAFEGIPYFLVTAPEGSFAYLWAKENGHLPEDCVLESAHPYDDNMDETTTYVHDTDAYKLTVAFSAATEFESGCDFLYITDSEGTTTQYTGDRLSGATLILPGNRFTLRMVTDGSVRMFGYRILSVEALTKEEFDALYMYQTEVLGDGTIQINGYNGENTDPVIPAEINGTAVTAIGPNAFYGCTDLTSVTLPSTLTTIGSYAFYNCDGLTGISLPDSLRSISSYAFADCGWLSSVVIPEGVTFAGEGAFSSCSGLTEVTLPSTLTEISNSMFNSCALSSIVIPEGVASIGSNAFHSCPNLGEVTIPGSVRSIGSSAFAHCYTLSSVTVSEGVSEIHDLAFSNCGLLANVSLPASLGSIADTVFESSATPTVTAPEGSYAYGWAVTRGYIEEKAILESDHPYADNADQMWEYVHPEDAYALAVTFSAQTQFENGCDYLTLTDDKNNETRYTGSMLSGKTIAVMGSSFSLHLTTDVSVTYFGYRITKIEALTEEEYVNFGEFTHRTLADGTLAVTGYTGFKTDLEIPAEIDGVKVTSIDQNAFAYNNITSLVIPEGVTAIHGSAFQNCASLTSVSLPGTLTFIGNYAFGECTALTGITIPEGVTQIDGSVFSSCHSLMNVSLPKSLTVISGSAFYNCSSLTEITIPEGVTSIEDHAFGYCYSLASASLPASLTYIHENAFYSSDNLLITAPEGAYAYNWAAENNYLDIAVIESGHPYEGQTTLTWDYTAQNEGTYALLVTFARRTSLSSEDCLTIIDETGSEYNYRNNDLAGRTVPIIGDSFSLRLNSINGGSFGFAVTKIQELSEEEYLNYGGYTYYEQGDGTIAISEYTGLLPNLEIPSEIDGCPVAAISGSAFYDNDCLESVVIPEGVTYIGNSAFQYCDKLRSVVIPGSVETIESQAFYSCRSLTEISIPEGVTSIGGNAFGWCISLTSLTLPQSLTTLYDFAFSNCDSLTSVTLPGNLTEIYPYTFAWCHQLKSITLPGSLSVIDAYAFQNCSNLAEVTVSEGVTSIEPWAFGECRSLETVTLPESLTFIDENAFANSPDVKSEAKRS